MDTEMECNNAAENEVITGNQLLETLSSDDNALAFVDIVMRHNDNNKDFSLDQQITAMSDVELQQLAELLYNFCAKTLLHFNISDEHAMELEDGGGQTIDSGIVLEAIVTVLHIVFQFVHTSDKVHNASAVNHLFETTVCLHGILLILPDSHQRLQSNIIGLCERYRKQDIEGWMSLMPNTLIYLLNKCLASKPMVADVKRVYALRSCLNDLDLMSGDEAAKTLRTLLTCSVKSENILKVEEGRKFLACLFNLNEPLIGDLHIAVKMAIPFIKKSYLGHLGEVYYLAWRNSEEPFTQNLEITCIQDFMHMAVHGKHNTLALCMIQVLSHFHARRGDKKLEAMLLRLYEPILWRVLKAANNEVRSNAASVFVEIFPLQGSGSAQENENLLIKQFELLEELLEDPVPGIRASVAQGVGKILSQFWELFPTSVIQRLMSKLLQKLAVDASSVDVRVSVIKGFTAMLTNRLMHTFLATVLPKLLFMFHDKSLLVRIAMTDLLLRAKKLKTLKFWEIVPVAHLQSRLATDEKSMVVRLVTLLDQSYMPSDKPAFEQFVRGLQLIRENPAAARVFYINIYRRVKAADSACRFILLSVGYLARCAEKRLLTTTANNSIVSDMDVSNSRQSAVEEDSSDKENEDDESAEDKEAEEEARSMSHVDTNDCQLIACLLDCIFLFWTSMKSKIEKMEKPYRKKFELSISHKLQVLFRAYDDHNVISALISVAGCLPVSALANICCSLISLLKSNSENVAIQQFAPILDTMCLWRKGSDVMDFICDWLEECFKNEVASSDIRPTHVVRFSDPVVSKPSLALKYLDHMMAQMLCQSTLVMSSMTYLQRVTACLKMSMMYVERRVKQPDTLSKLHTDDMLINAFERYIRMNVILHNTEERRKYSLRSIDEVLLWVTRHLFTALGASGRRQARKLLQRGNQTLLSDPSDEFSETPSCESSADGSILSATTSGRREFILRVIEILLNVINNMLMTSAYDKKLLSHCGDFLNSLMQREEFLGMLPMIITIMSRLCDVWKAGESLNIEKERGFDDENSKNEDNEEIVDPLPELIDSLLKFLLKSVQTKPEQSRMLFTNIKAKLRRVLKMYYDAADLDSTLTQEVMTCFVSTVVTEMIHTMKQTTEFELCESPSDLPPLSSLIILLTCEKPSTSTLFISQLSLMCNTSLFDTIEGLGAGANLLHPLTTVTKYPLDELTGCLQTLQTKLDHCTLPNDIMDDSPIRHKYESVTNIISACRERIDKRKTTAATKCI